jgi:carbonic anhydrase
MNHAACTCHAPAAIGRRRFVTMASLTGATLATLIPRIARAGTCDALLLNCMDYRLTDKVTAYMAAQGMTGKYDQVILAGASLGAVTLKFPDWGRTFRQHLDVAIQLHGIHEVIVIDHRDCGAYRVILGKDYAGDPAAETKIHAEMLHKLRAEILHAHPKLGVKLGLMALDGTVENIA